MSARTVKPHDKPVIPAKSLPLGGRTGAGIQPRTWVPDRVRDDEQKPGAPDACSTPSPGTLFLRSYLDRAPKGTAAKLAEEAGISAGTVSRIRTGNYAARGGDIVERLAGIIRDREAAEAIASGRYKPEWLMNNNGRLRLVKRAATVEALRERFPEARIYQVWKGSEGDIKILEVAMTGISATELRRQRIEDAMIEILSDGRAYTQRELQEKLSKSGIVGTNYSLDAIYVTVGHVVRTFRRDFYRDPSTGKIALSAHMLARIKEEAARVADLRRTMGNTASGITGACLDAAEAGL